MLLTPEQLTRALRRCAEEPIHIPGAIQAHGILLGLEEQSLTIARVSDNAASYLGRTPDDLLGRPLAKIVGADAVSGLAERVSGGDRRVPGVQQLELEIDAERRCFDAAVHRASGLLLLELETAGGIEAAAGGDPLGIVGDVMRRMREADDLPGLAAMAARAVRALTGFGRVDVYQFAEDWSGHVIGEARAEGVHGFLDWRFPAADIPEQARALYRKSAIRLIPDVDYAPAAIVGGADAPPLDLTHGLLRSVSPVHLAYLRNMGVAASMSVSIEVAGRLWGLIACHHARPRFVAAERRRLAELVAQAFAGRLALLAEKERADRTRAVQSILQDLIAAMDSSTAPIEVLSGERDDLVRMVDADGLIIRFDKRVITAGALPSAAAIARLLDWLDAAHPGGPCIANEPPPALALSDADEARLGGLLACPLPAVPGGRIVWLRGERRHTYKWAGDPGKSVEVDDADFRVSPRASFALYETEHAHAAEPWSEWEKVAASLVAQAVTQTVTRHELERSNADLDQFAYAVSHDLQEPMRGVTGYADLLRRGYADRLDDKARHYLAMMTDGAERMQALLSGMLQYSRLTRTTTALDPVDLNDVAGDAVANLAPAIGEAGALVTLGELPSVLGHREQLARVFQNLIGNAIKYRGEAAPRIDVSASREAGQWTISVADNGVGIDPVMRQAIFLIFRRADVSGKVAGLGLGLAMCKRIVERHGGRIWAESPPGGGSVFRFTLPAPPDT